MEEILEALQRIWICFLCTIIPQLVAITNTSLCPFSLTVVLISIHSSFSWRPFPISVFVLIRLTSLINFGYTWTGDQSAKFMRLRKDWALKDSYLCIPKIQEGSGYQHLLWHPRTWLLQRKVNNLSLSICKRSLRGCCNATWVRGAQDPRGQKTTVIRTPWARLPPVDTYTRGRCPCALTATRRHDRCKTTHANVCSDLYGYPFAHSSISIVRLAIRMVQERTTTRYLAVISGEEIRNSSYNAQCRCKLCVWHHLHFIKVTRWEDKLIPLACPHLEKGIGELCSSQWIRESRKSRSRSLTLLYASRSAFGLSYDHRFL